jgi:hypothetical protein
MDYTNGLGGIYVVDPQTGDANRVASDAPASKQEAKSEAPAKAKASRTITTEALKDAPSL